MPASHEIFSRKFATLNRTKSLFFFLFAVFALSFGVILDFSYAVYGLFSGLVFLSVSLIYFSKFVTWNLGARGEELVIEELRKLDKEFRVINDINLQNMDGNIDHIVICEKGIFVIETKHHNGAIRYENGKWTQEKTGFNGKSYSVGFGDPIRQARYNAIKLKEFIAEHNIFPETFTPWISTIVVFTNPNATLQIDGAPTAVVELAELCRTIQNKKSKIRLRRSEMTELLDILKSKRVSSESGKSSFEALIASSWLNSYLKHIKFGFIWSMLFTLNALLVLQVPKNVPGFNITQVVYWVLLDGVVLFVLGKVLIDLFKVQIKNTVLRLSLTYFAAYLPLVVLVTLRDFFDPAILPDEVLNSLGGYIYEFLTRLLMIILTVVIYRALRQKVPT